MSLERNAFGENIVLVDTYPILNRITFIILSSIRYPKIRISLKDVEKHFNILSFQFFVLATNQMLASNILPRHLPES